MSLKVNECESCVHIIIKNTQLTTEYLVFGSCFFSFVHVINIETYVDK